MNHVINANTLTSCRLYINYYYHFTAKLYYVISLCVYMYAFAYNNANSKT